MRTRAACLILAALAGAAVLAWLGPRFDTTLNVWRPGLSGSQAAGHAQRLAAAEGLDIRSWPYFVEVVTHDRRRDARELLPSDPLLRDFPLLEYRVAAANPAGGETVIITVASDGRPSSFLWRKPVRGYRGTEPLGDAIARRELERFAGPAARLFHPTAEGVRTQEGSRWAWEFPAAAGRGMLAQFYAVIRDGRLVHVEYDLQVGELVTRPAAERSRQIFLPIVAIIVVAAMIGIFYALWTVFARATHLRDHLQFAFRLLPFFAAVILIDLVSGNALNSFRFNALTDENRGQAWALPAFAIALMILGSGFLSLAAGYADLSAGQRRSWISLRLLASGDLLRRRVGRELTLGLLSGVICAAIPYALAALPGVHAGLVSLTGPSGLSLPHPELVPLRQFYPFNSLMVFAVLMPLAGRAFSGPWLRGAATALIGIPFAALSWSPYETALWPTLAVSLAVWIVYCFLYETEGLVAVWAVPAGTVIAVQALMLLGSQSPVLSALGLRSALLWCSTATAAAALWALGRPVDEAAVAASMEPGEKHLSRSEREQLQAMLAVARRAQQRMLPAAPPAIPGFGLAAACQPAREVGGDLYEFLDMPQGRWVLCVGDVSGKGLPAALYMTLTSGMLASARLHDETVAEMSLHLNRLLTAAGQRRTFVTMVLAALDPATATVTLARAGHNPPLLVRPEGPAVFLQPSGIGLGFTAGPAFENNLVTTSFRLGPGDTLLLYSDGLVECMNPDRELYGEDRLKALAEQHRHLDPEPLRDAILESARDFRGAAEPHDDMTLLILKATGPYDNQN
jgi:serine phosphatase RsbU (regulator of sigma subunit)/type III secretory pathway component EscS